MTTSTSPAANIIRTYRDGFAGAAALVVTDSSGNVLRRHGRKTYPTYSDGGKAARRVSERSTERGVAFRVVPAADLAKLLA